MSNFVWQEAAALKPSRFGLHLGSILFTFVLGGDLECPDCGMGYLIPIETPPENAQTLVCDVCCEVFELADDDD